MIGKQSIGVVADAEGDLGNLGGVKGVGSGGGSSGVWSGGG